MIDLSAYESFLFYLNRLWLTTSDSFDLSELSDSVMNSNKKDDRPVKTPSQIPCRSKLIMATLLSIDLKLIRGQSNGNRHV